MIVGGIQIYGVAIWESIRTHVVLPIQEHYDTKSIIDVFFCPHNNDTLHADLQQHITATQLHTFIGDDIGTHFLPFDGYSQFGRVAVCYQKLKEYLKNDNNEGDNGNNEQQHHQPYDFIIKTRPDMWWFHSIPLPFSKKHVMGRAQKARGMNLTLAQMSYLVCEPCHKVRNDATIHSPPCIMMDDQIAVVPRVNQERYFHFCRPDESTTDIDFDYTVNVSDDAVIVNDVNVNWPVVKLETNETCPCVLHWPEGQLTSALAALNVTYMVAPFQVRLTEKEGFGFRWRGGVKDFDEIKNCM